MFNFIKTQHKARNDDIILVSIKWRQSQRTLADFILTVVLS